MINKLMVVGGSCGWLRRLVNKFDYYAFKLRFLRIMNK